MTTDQSTRPASAARPTERHVSYGAATAGTLVAAFTLSVVHTVYAWREGLEDPAFTVDTPVTWVFYAVGFAVAALARRDSRPAQWVVLTFLVLVSAIAVFYYPVTFTGEKQTVFGWFENDVYVALLGLALFLTVVRLRRITLVPDTLQLVA